METTNLSDKIINTLSKKALLKQGVFETTLKAFALINEIVKDLTNKYNSNIKGTKVKIWQGKTGTYDLQLKIGSDILIFSMHTNVFQFNKENVIWKHSYLKDNPSNGYVGQISIYNFLTDSFENNRLNDLGYLVARLFINRENHYIVEGKRQLSYRNNDISECVANRENLERILETSIDYAINFDLLVPPYDAVKIANVEQMHQKSHANKLQTGKRMGFQFNTDDI